MILLDANILLRLSDNKDPHYQTSLDAIFKLRKRDTLVIISQCLQEYWAVATRSPAHNGLGMNADRAKRWLERFRAMFNLLEDKPSQLDYWQTLVHQFDIKGFQAHDAKYVAAMLAHGVTQFMTYNLKHFRNFPITVVDPNQV